MSEWVNECVREWVSEWENVPDSQLLSDDQTFFILVLLRHINIPRKYAKNNDHPYFGAHFHILGSHRKVEVRLWGELRQCFTIESVSARMTQDWVNTVYCWQACHDPPLVKTNVRQSFCKVGIGCRWEFLKFSQSDNFILQPQKQRSSAPICNISKQIVPPLFTQPFIESRRLLLLILYCFRQDNTPPHLHLTQMWTHSTQILDHTEHRS